MARRFTARKLEPGDLRAVFLLGKKIFRTYNPFLLSWSEENLAEALARGKDFSLVAVRKKEIGGFLIATAEDGPKQVITILWLGVAETLKGHGTEEMLIAELMEGLPADTGVAARIMLDRTRGDLPEIMKEAGFTEKGAYIVMERVKE